jgi:hypothetical protein
MIEKTTGRVLGVGGLLPRDMEEYSKCDCFVQKSGGERDVVKPVYLFIVQEIAETVRSFLFDEGDSSSPRLKWGL